MSISSDDIEKIFSLRSGKRFEASIAAPLDYEEEVPFISYLADSKFQSKLNGNKNIVALFIRQEDLNIIAPHINISAVVCDDPKWYFFKLIDYLGKKKSYEKSVIDTSTSIHKTAVIAETGVTIGRNVIIDPNVVIMPGVTVGDNCYIRAGAIIGCDGFEQKRTSKGVLSVTHDGIVKIGDSVEIGPNNNVAKGFAYRNTIVGEYSKFDALVHFAHSAQCGDRCFFAANVVVAGSACIGNDVWIGPSATVSSQVRIGDGANITLGAVVVRDVESGEHVTGNFAIKHSKFIRHVLSISR